MKNQFNLNRRAVSGCGKSLEPMLGYCSKILPELNKDDSEKLTEDLLSVLKDFRPIFKSKNQQSSLDVNFINWGKHVPQHKP
ncbi:MAG: hypothetical protein H0U73_08675 [Tatlockia sp.]|nr:hypothetical protein [Tatlockia sp.]